MINRVQAEALKGYMSKTGYVPSKRVEKLVIDACGVTDESFSKILTGIFGQCGININNNTVKDQFL